MNIWKFNFNRISIEFLLKDIGTHSTITWDVFLCIYIFLFNKNFLFHFVYFSVWSLLPRVDSFLLYAVLFLFNKNLDTKAPRKKLNLILNESEKYYFPNVYLVFFLFCLIVTQAVAKGKVFLIIFFILEKHTQKSGQKNKLLLNHIWKKKPRLSNNDILTS